MNLDSKKIVDFPSRNLWGEFYSRFRKSLLAKLSSYYCLADREDAVEFAFDKLMNKKDKNAYGDKMPKTENGWFWALYWQAKSYLSHMREHGVVHAKYVEEMAKELENVFAPGYFGGFLDNEVISLDKIDSLAKLPSREVLLATVCNAFNAPISAFARAVQAIVDKGGEATAEAAAE